ncbi:hypothetical protein [Bradyrhizobium cenepequi]|uniref:hypothetical protein n=1 Tax=Bradyrhizobium cenepequi TaxID=2821403 RepID=UPI0040648F3D
MIVAMIAVGMVQMPGDEIIDMVAMRDRFVAAARAMDVSSIMSGAAMVGRATIRVRVAHLNPMFVHMIGVRVVKMAIVQIIHVVAVPDGNVAALGSMHVVVVGMMRKVAGGHFRRPFLDSVVFASMRNGILDEFEYMVIGDRIDRVLAFAPTFDQPGLQQHLQACRNRADCLVFGLSEFADIPLARSQNDEGLEPRRIGQSLEHGCGLLNARPINGFHHRPSFYRMLECVTARSLSRLGKHCVM